MAKKKKQGKGKKISVRPVDPKAANAQAIQDLVGKKESKGASALSNELFSEGSLGRVGSGFDANGNRVYENQDILDRLAATRNAYATGGRSGAMSDALGTAKSLAQGYTAPEYGAMRESAAQGLNQDYATRAAQMMKAQARGGVRGAAAIAGQGQLDRSRLQAQGNLERDLFVRGADEKRRASESYLAQLQGAETDEFGRMSQTANDYADRLGAMRADELGRQQANLQQVGAEKAGQYGAYFGALDLAERKQARKKTNQLSNRMIDVYRGSGRGGSSGGGPNYQGYVDEARKVVG